MLAIKIKNPKTMASYLVAGVVTGLEPINGIEDRAKNILNIHVQDQMKLKILMAMH